MTTTPQKIGAAVVGVLALLGACAFFGLTPFGKSVVTEVSQTAQQYGDVVPNVQQFTAGFQYGQSNALFMSNLLTVNNGSDQAVWQNQTGKPVVIDTTHIITNATSSASIASSTYQFSVGATSTATIPENNKVAWITSTLTPLSITNFTLATSNPVAYLAGGIAFREQADNYAYHASSTAGLNNSASIVVPPNWYFFVKIDTNCPYSAAGIACESATSTNRGFTTVSVPFWYHYSNP